MVWRVAHLSPVFLHSSNQKLGAAERGSVQFSVRMEYVEVARPSGPQTEKIAGVYDFFLKCDIDDQVLVLHRKG